MPVVNRRNNINDKNNVSIMSNHVLITGSAGSGKTTLANYFKEHGKNGIDADLSGIGEWLNEHGSKVEIPKDINMRRINEWAEARGLKWHWNEKRLRELLYSSDEIYFVGGAHNAFDLKRFFDKCYYLDADEKTIIERLEKRYREGTNYHDYGSTEDQKGRIVRSLGSNLERARREGFVIIDTSLSIKQIFEFITKDVNPKKVKL